MAPTQGDNYFLHAPMNAERDHLWVRERWSDVITEVVRENGVRDLHLEAWREPDLRFLPQIADYITFLDIIACFAPDISHVGSLKRLKRLSALGTLEQINFAGLDSLEECNLVPEHGLGDITLNRCIRILGISRIQRMKDLTAIASMTQLEELGFAGTPLKSLSGIEQLTGLKDFGINRAPLVSLAGIEAVKGLRHLSLVLLTKLESLEPISTLKELRGLGLICCKKVRDLSPLVNLKRLNLLAIEDNAEFETIRPLETLVNLKEFSFHGSTKILDGDLSVLAKLPRLRKAFYKKWSHYRPSFEEINEIRRAKGWQPLVQDGSLFRTEFDP